MSTVLTPTLSAVRQVPPKKWTVKEFHALGSTGKFEGRRLILLRGVILEQGMMKPPHAVAVGVVLEALGFLLPLGFCVRVQLPLVLSLDTDPMPDIAVVPGKQRDYVIDHPTKSPLVIEISDTTFDTDVTDKAELYATAGIADYWVLDFESRQLLVFRDPVPLPAGLGATAYRDRSTYGPTDPVAPLHFPAVSIRVADLLP
ncbi:Uma2 family endonuclease [Limnoglobus roseus]|uniref:Uma2 family endonuclease n=1 Tax=Limnoglobus roseus TaxID=2598579 RepID=A0A5C1AKC6_9BACT|nr:Uma2 family endonuclease [Limnoglobus roseus]QEL18152.1 Uma2 family endonuclease [Limnoglobus roseus]